MPADNAKLARREVIVFLILAFGLSSIFYYLSATTTLHSDLLLFTLLLMWCPATAAIITRLYFQKNLKGFGFGWGETKWQLAGILMPILLGLIMFGLVWLTMGVFSPEGAASVLSFAFLPALAAGLAFNLFATFGEELGWRGLLVPEMSKFMGFTKLALLSSAIWAVWHFPLIIFGHYHGVGPLWYSLLIFTPAVIGIGVVLAWLRLKSGSLWPAVFFHGVWNYFIQQFYPMLTVETEATQLITGEFGWACPAMLVVLGLIFWHYRDRLPKAIRRG